MIETRVGTKVPGTTRGVSFRSHLLGVDIATHDRPRRCRESKWRQQNETTISTENQNGVDNKTTRQVQEPRWRRLHDRITITDGTKVALITENDK